MHTDPWTPEDLLWRLNEAEQKHAPKELFVAGDRDLLRAGPTVSIVGSRKVRLRSLAVIRTMSGGEVDGLLSPVDDGCIRMRSGVPRREP